MRVALDLDSTLAQSLPVATEIAADDGCDGLDYYEIDDWQHPIDKYGAETLFNAFDTAWNDHTDAITPCEPDLSATVSLLRDYHTVDIVTAHPQLTDTTATLNTAKQTWLAEHDIEYHEFRSVAPSMSKAQLPYDVYIDDKPTLPARVAEREIHGLVYVRGREYNTGLDAPHRRVTNVAQAVLQLVLGD